jgi:adenosylcobyric acid synthase
MCVDNLNLLSFLLSKCPWLLVANDEIGGVFAQVVGTKMCVSKRDWSLCVGIIVNKVKSEIKDFLLGLKMLEQMTGKPLYAMPFIDDLDAPNEISIDIERKLTWEKGGCSKRDHQSEANRLNRLKREKPCVVVVAYPHTTISNDLYPIEKDNRFHLEWRRKRLPKLYPVTTAVILPGSRLPLLDLKWLRVSFSLDFSLKIVPRCACRE